MKIKKRYYIYQGYMHEECFNETAPQNEEEEEIEEAPQDNMKISADRMYRWLIKKSELFKDNY